MKKIDKTHRQNPSQIRKPVFYDEFICTAGECPFTCCQEWHIGVDPKTVRKWACMPDLRKGIAKDRGQTVMALRQDRKCIFLNAQGLCGVQRRLGEQMIPETCRVFPRETHDFGSVKETSLMPACPAVLDILRAFGEKKKNGKLVHFAELFPPCGDDRFAIRNFFIELLDEQDHTLNEKLLAIFFIMKEILEAEGSGGDPMERFRDASSTGTRTAFFSSLDAMTFHIADTLWERNELLLDLADNYRKEGLYQNRLEPLAELAEQFEEADSEEEEQKNLKLLGAFQEEMKQWDPFFTLLLSEEFFADLLLPDGTLTEMAQHLEWIGMIYAAIRHSLYLIFRKRAGSDRRLTYEEMRDIIVLIFRMTGYEEADLQEYLENSFESSIWDWGYFALIIGR